MHPNLREGRQLQHRNKMVTRAFKDPVGVLYLITELETGGAQTALANLALQLDRRRFCLLYTSPSPRDS